MTVYILHYANNSLTNACLAAWLEQTVNIVVIDNGSPLPYVPAREVRVVRLEQNLHLIPANNAGMTAQPSGWYFCVNNDVFPAPGCLKRMLDVFTDPDIGIAAPGSSDMNAGILHVAPGQPREDVVTRHVDNHAIMFTSDVVDEIGLPDAEGHPHRANWYANKLYCYKARKAGYKVLAVRSAFVDHRRDSGYDETADRLGQEWIKARLGAQLQEAW